MTRLNRAVFLLLILAAATIPIRVYADSEPNVEALRALSLDAARRDAERRTPRFIEFYNRETAPRIAQRAESGLQLMYLDDTGHPVYYQTDNLTAARTINVEVLWSPPWDLTGSGLSLGQLGVWDGGGVRTTHNAFEGRVTQMDSPSGNDEHATHVSGTMVSGSLTGNAIGMAHDAPLAAYDWNGDESEMASAAAGGMRASNHSYSVVTGWRYGSDGNWYWYGNLAYSTTEDNRFGLYDSSAQDWDEIAYNAPGYLIFKSAGNDRNDYGPGAGGGHYVYNNGWVWSTDTRDFDGGTDGYDSLPPKGTAKNIMTVGSVGDLATGYTTPGAVQISSFSSYGPTDDGRIKPDVVANGEGLLSPGNDADNSYVTLSGTSMSSPSAAGASALMVERYFEVNGAYPQASTLKAMIINAADECGSAPGPDYRSGWGLVNAGRVIQEIDDGIIFEGTITNGQTVEYELLREEGYPLKATLVWTDPPGPVRYGLNPTASVLKNDLDLRVIQDAVTHEPWVLDPASPSVAATTGDNVLDNVEQVEILSPGPGDYTFRITHKGYLTAPQSYSLVISGATDTPPDWVNVTTPLLAGTANSTGVACIDYDSDGDLDLYVSNIDQSNVLLQNDAGVFSDVTAAPLDIGNDSWASAWVDYDDDGDLDLYVTCDNAPNFRIRNDGTGFTDHTISPLNDAGPARSVNWVDHNGDGLMDLYIVNYNSANKMLECVGDYGGLFLFGTVSGLIADPETGICASWADYDNDADPDCYLTNFSRSNVLFGNYGDLGYSDESSGGLDNSSMGQGVAWGDYDNDGLLDLYFVNNLAPDYLFRNTGSGFASIVGGALGDNGPGRSVAWGDYDNDGDLDLYVTRYGQQDLLMTNDGSGAFSIVTQGLPNTAGNHQGAVWIDFDGDGDLDLYVAADGGNMLIRNDLTNENHWLHVKPIGTESNSSAVGARVRIVAGGVSQIREITSGSGYMSQQPLRANFGLGAAEIVDSLIIDWPSGIVQTLTDVAADQLLFLSESDGESAVGEQPARDAFRLLPNVPNPFNPITRIRFSLPERSDVTIQIFDVSGRRVRSLRDGAMMDAGLRSVEWNGDDDRGRPVPSGAYYYVVQSDGARLTGRMSLVK